MSWLLAHTIAQREYQMRDRLISASLGAYVPSRRNLIYPRHTRKPRLVRYPLFARYLFVWVEDILSDYRVMRSVSSDIWAVRTDKHQFICVDDRDIDSLVTREHGGEFDHLTEDDDIKFVIGVEVLITSGPFAEYRGTVKQFIRPKHKCRIDLSTCSLEVDIDLLDIAS